jgi:hypothetical protein
MFWRLILVLVLAGLLLGACRGDDDPKPTATSGPPGSSSISDPTTSATLAPGEVTAGQIADRIGAAWAGVASYRAVTRILPAIGTPMATPAVELAASAERHVILPDRKRFLITDQGATTEIVLADGELWKRSIPPGGEPGAWDTVNPAEVAPADPFARTYQTILAPEAPPYSALSDRQRDRIGTGQGSLNIAGQECAAYLFPEVSETGERIEVFVYLGPDDLPCRIETRAGLTISQTDYVFNQEPEIATPVAVASPTAP